MQAAKWLQKLYEKPVKANTRANMRKWSKPRNKDRFTATELTDVDPDNPN
jgi:hypothetical protein